MNDLMSQWKIKRGGWMGGGGMIKGQNKKIRKKLSDTRFSIAEVEPENYVKVQHSSLST